jgi:8-oxo-dGTP pyrophosphatase MutT (NUDIX family)
MVWKPDVTVAAVVERDGRFLLIEEQTSTGLRLNQPAGHLEPNESIVDAVIRETREETTYDFLPTELIGIYRWSKQGDDLSYLRFAFTGNLGEHHPEQPLDSGILRTVWLTRNEVLGTAQRHRSPLVIRCIDDYLAGKRFAIDSLIECA